MFVIISLIWQCIVAVLGLLVLGFLALICVMFIVAGFLKLFKGAK
ncbi:hypothetical protein [Streptococcus sciuri]|uniref:Uncharacterized protein n=1 Tax=Streptococcus sciuri TaxID=2973939 RepID=A0ABT2F7P1_9STRE|nr:hypothetical protein [Streptococcus sciuri]MCS4488405.1 hypothetical protein [Streptococcus sciuri]